MTASNKSRNVHSRSVTPAAITGIAAGRDRRRGFCALHRGQRRGRCPRLGCGETESERTLRPVVPWSALTSSVANGTGGHRVLAPASPASHRSHQQGQAIPGPLATGALLEAVARSARPTTQAGLFRAQGDTGIGWAAMMVSQGPAPAKRQPSRGRVLNSPQYTRQEEHKNQARAKNRLTFPDQRRIMTVLKSSDD